MGTPPRARPRPITAHALCNGLGQTTEDVARTLYEGRRGLGPCPLDVPFETVTGNVTGELPAPPSSHTAYDSRCLRLTLLAYEPVAAAVEHACRRWGPARVALILATSTGGILETEGAHKRWYHGGSFPETYDYARQHPFHAFADALRDLSGIEGPRYVVSTACSSSAKVLGSAMRLMEMNLVDAALVGGVDSLCYTTVRGFHSLGVLSSAPSRPFAEDRAGMNIGEGAALMLLEREGEAASYVVGVGESSDAYHPSSPDPEGKGATLAMRRALAQAAVEPDEVDHVNAHGTGTKHNDLAEAQALHGLFGSHVPVTSTKSYTGHTLGACGGTEAVFAMWAIERGWIPANLGLESSPPEGDLRVPTIRLDQRCRYTLSNAFAFGGNNCSVVFGAPV